MVLDSAAVADPAPAVRRLHASWADREPVVIRMLADPAGFRAPVSVVGEPWGLDAGHELWADRLHFLVWANSYDARSGPEPAWWWARKAARLGAVEGAPGDGPGDVWLPGGTPAWVDGGPRSPFSPEELGGAALVHRETVERGRLVPAPAPRPPTADLAADQMAAVVHHSGPARVIAPAGSGKTRVLSERLRHLLGDRGWEPSTVLAVAYNKKAQEELEVRCAGLGARTRTLNSLGLAVLGAARGAQPRVFDERDTRRLVERLAPVHGRRRTNTDPISPYLEGLSAVRLGLTDPAVVEEGRDDVPGLAEMFPRYRAALAETGAVDFDEQVYGAIEALLADGAFRLATQARHRHLLVDEFQDLTPAHVLLLRLLAGPQMDVFGVGDDDQVIYGHAGADPGFLIGYAGLFPGAGYHPLEVNYRCPPAIVAAAVHLLGYNRRRVPKAIRAARAGVVTDEPALVVRHHRSGAGAADLAGIVDCWRREGTPPTGIAVLARVNALLLAPHVALAEAGVPMTSALRPDVLERTGLRAALAYLRLATAADDQVASADLVEVLRRPSRGLPPWFADRLRRRRCWAVHGLLDLAASVPDKDAPKVDRLVGDVLGLRAAAGSGATTAELLRMVRDDVGLGGAMTLLDRSKGGEGSSHLDDLEALEQVAGLQEDPERFEPWLRDRFERAADPAGVTLSTVHRVKGLEWDRVVVYGVTAGVLPHRLAADEEEERRVLHVAITRARERVVLLADGSRPSPFLAELDGSAPRRRPPEPPARALAAPAGRYGGPAGDPALEAALRAWRLERSRRDRVPAYVVCGDKTLRAIAAARPSSLVALRQVDGIGPAKLDSYGEEILEVVAGQ